MQNNLIPPSHFDNDSLNPSQQESGQSSNASSPRNSSSVGLKITANTKLKTPGDFCKPKQLRFNDLNSHHKPTKFFHSPNYSNLKSQDSGYSCDLPFLKNISTSDEDFAEAFHQLKMENQNLQEIIKRNLSNKDPVSNYNVITHQVQYIERLQQDVAAATNKLNSNQSLLSKMELEIQEKDFLLQQNQMKCTQMATEIKEANENNCKLSDVVANLKASLNSSSDEQGRLRQENEENLVILKKEHQKEMEKIVELNRKQVEDLRIVFESEKRSWEVERRNENDELKSQHLAFLEEERQKLNDHLKTFEFEKNQINEQKQKLEEEIKETNGEKKTLGEAIKTLRQELQDSNNALQSKEKEIKALSDDLQRENDTNIQLKAYISQVQTEEHAREKWKTEKDEMIASANAHAEEKVELEKTLEMLRIRFESVSKILKMQEESITVHTEAMPDSSNQNKAGVVTARWREKVFELMVQCKTQEIVEKEQYHRHTRIVRDLNNQIAEQFRELQILASRVQDVDAQLQLQIHQNTTLNGKNEKLKLDLASWKDKCIQQDETVQKLRDVVKAMNETYNQAYEDNLSSCFERCLRMEQRLAFANNRIRAVQDLMKRKESMWRVRLQELMNGSTNNVEIDSKAKDNPDIQLEILKLTEERDLLSQQLANDAAQFEQTIITIKKREAECKQTNHGLEKQLISNEEKISELKSVIQELEKNLEDEKYEKESFLSELNQCRKATKQEVTDAIDEVKQQHYLELKNQETNLNQVKRDLTKAVVSLRQAERNSTREKNQLTEQLEAERNLWLTEEEKLRDNIRNLQKENNLFMTTLRQEGLLLAVKASRNPPILEKKEETPPKRVQFKVTSSPESNKSKCIKSIDVDKMLQDLTNLSEMVLAQSDSD